ncbi:MAG: exo-alpha-sialidase [Candidatus Berkelbacteria bacterium]|nr:exo-alpha-sialidase [Candidatus Berkelbacteria bacterium]MCR4307912.1 exo-alpha-sialidase [Candidatus Berkelbacteria bacterium]
MELNEIHTEHEHASTSLKVVLSIFAIVLIGALAYFVWNAGQTPDNSTEATTVTKPKNTAQYNWSTSAQGPYKDKISFATSKDLLIWTDQKTILASHVSVPGAIIKDGTIYLYFVDVNADGVAEKLGLMTSKDNGLTWTEKTNVKFTGIGDKVPVDPAPFLMEDGTIRIYYFDINEGRSDTKSTNKIYSAISTDGTNFTQEEGVRFAKNDIFDPFVLKDGSIWRLYAGLAQGNSVVSATSTDGLTFTEEGTAFTGGSVPFVQKEGDTYYLYTAGINIATSTNGSKFTATGKSFLSTVGKVTADPSVLKLADGTYLMFYKTN